MRVARMCTVIAFTAMALAAATAVAETGARVLRVVGSVEVATGEPPSWRPAQPGQALAPGTAIRTGDGARAEIGLDSGTIRVYENSLLKIPARRDPGVPRLWLGLGAGIFDVKLRPGERFEVETPEAVAAVKGTRFLVTLERGRASFGVYEGVVELRDLDAGPAQERLLVHEGFTARSEGGTFELLVLDRGDVWGAWEAGARPPDRPSGSALPDLGVEPSSEDEPAGDAAPDSAREALDDAQPPEPAPADADSVDDEHGTDGDRTYEQDADLFEVDPFEQDADALEDREWQDSVESEDTRGVDHQGQPVP